MTAVVRPGDVVLDLGSGSGILGFLALQAGAARVYAIDNGGIITVARELAAANGLSGRITFIREHSTRATLPEKVDVVVCDQLGPLGIEAGAIEYLRDAERRFLKPGGRTIPCGVAIWAAALESDDLRDRLDFWQLRPAGLDLTPARSIALNTGYPAPVDADQLLSEGAEVVSTAIPAPPTALHGEATVRVTRSGRLDGVCAWFVAQLAPGVTMTNAPMDGSRIARRQVMLPIGAAVDVEPGDALIVRLLARSSEVMVLWEVTVRRGTETIHASRHSTFQGMLVSAEERAMTDPAKRPTLTDAGLARRTILELCDGTRTIAEIDRAVFERHRALFADPADASAFVAEVLTRYGR